MAQRDVGLAPGGGSGKVVQLPENGEATIELGICHRPYEEDYLVDTWVLDEADKFFEAELIVREPVALFIFEQACAIRDRMMQQASCIESGAELIGLDLLEKRE